MYIQIYTLFMQFITATELRTKSKDLFAALEEGKVVNLIHKSKVVGEIKPKKSKVKVFNAKRMKRIVEKMNLELLSYKERERRYRKHIMKKYGQGLS